jgi:hypothetical protein
MLIVAGKCRKRGTRVKYHGLKCHKYAILGEIGVEGGLKWIRHVCYLK